MKPLPTWNYESVQWQQGSQVVVGIDEVGRGCLAGPVVVGAVAFTREQKKLPGIADSKLLSSVQRQKALPLIQKHSLFSSIGSSSVEEINTLGLSKSLLLAMQRAIQAFPKIDHLLLDGKPLKATQEFLPYPTTWIIKGDQLSYSIAAASILAKEYRDTLMKSLAKEYPQYFWEKNVGYGTRSHREMIAQHGVCCHHRLSFIKLDTQGNSPFN